MHLNWIHLVFSIFFFLISASLYHLLCWNLEGFIYVFVYLMNVAFLSSGHHFLILELVLILKCLCLLEAYSIHSLNY